MLDRLIEQAPALVIMAFIVVKFLQAAKVWQEMFKSIDSKNREIYVRTLDCIDKNTEALTSMKETLSQCPQLGVKA